MKLNQEEIKTILPHRDPMLLVTSVEELTPGEEIRASFYADPAREIFPGHFPGNPVLPGVYTVECLGQAADLVVMTTERYAGKTPLLIGVDKARFTRKVRPGETLELRARLIHERAEKAIVTCAAEASVEGELALVRDYARAQIIFSEEAPKGLLLYTEKLAKANLKRQR